MQCGGIRGWTGMLDRPIRIADGIFQLRAIGARVTLLVEQGEALLVDTGLPGSSPVVWHGLRRLGMFPEQLTRVVLTHFHPDHCGGLGQLTAGREIAVSVHCLEADIVEGKAALPVVMPEASLQKMTQPIIGKLMGRPVPVDQRLDEGDLIPFGTEVRVVHVPGHTEGSIALLLPEKGVVIVGDALQYKLARRLSPPITLGCAQARQALRSLQRLASKDFDTVCFSHFPPLRHEPRKALGRLLEQQYDRSLRC